MTAQAGKKKQDEKPKRRFISTDVRLCILERHREDVSNETGALRGFIPVDDTGEDRQENPVPLEDLAKVQFHAGMVPIPCGIGEYQYEQLGVYETNDARKLEMLDAESIKARERGTPSFCREFTHEQERAITHGARCLGNTSIKARKALKDEGVELQE